MLLIYDAGSGSVVKSIAVGTPQLFKPVFSSDGAHILAGVSGGVRRWDIQSGRTLWGKGGGQIIALSADNRSLAAAMPNPAVAILDPMTGKQLRGLASQGAKVNGLDFSPDGRRLAVADDRSARVFETDTGRQLMNMIAHGSPVSDVVFASDGRLVTAGMDGSVKVWDAGGRLAKTLPHGSPVTAIAVAAGALAATAGYDGAVKLWKLDGETQPVKTIPAAGRVAVLAFSPDGRWLAAGGQEPVVKLWDVAAMLGGATVAAPVGKPKALSLAVEGVYQSVRKGWSTSKQLVGYSFAPPKLDAAVGEQVTLRVANKTSQPLPFFLEAFGPKDDSGGPAAGTLQANAESTLTFVPDKAGNFIFSVGNPPNRGPYQGALTIQPASPAAVPPVVEASTPPAATLPPIEFDVVALQPPTLGGGQEKTVEVVIKNGSTALKGAKILVESGNAPAGLTFDKETLVGDVAAGETKRASFKVKGEAGLAGGQAVLGVRVKAENAADGPVKPLPVMTQPAAPLPQVALSGSFPGTMRRGQTAQVRVVASNGGKLPAAGLRISVVCQGALALVGPAEQPFADLPPGKSRPFAYTIRAQAAGAGTVNVTVRDGSGRTVAVKTDNAVVK